MRTWNQSIDAARTFDRRALEGRFELTLVSFEQFAPFGRGYQLDGAGGRALNRTLLDWSDEVGINYHTLNGYRQVVSWWFDADPVRHRDELGIPDNITWGALKAGRDHWPMAVDFRDALEDHEPLNGHSFSADDVERIVRVEQPARRRRERKRPMTPSERFDHALGRVQRIPRGIERLAEIIGDTQFTQAQSAELADAIDTAVASLQAVRPADVHELHRTNSTQNAHSSMHSAASAM